MRTHSADVVVVGAGTAGLSAALHAEGRSVVVLTRGPLGGGSSPLAQGGVAAAIGPADSPEDHTNDTIAAGAGLCHENAVRSIVTEGPERIRALLRMGAAFDRETSGRLELGREGAHGCHRIVHARGDGTGAEIVNTLTRSVTASSRIDILEHHLALELLMNRGRVIGVLAVDHQGMSVAVFGGAVVLATGGVGALYSRTTNPREAIGSGLALAARAGARLAGLEFVQFHPTALDRPGYPNPLLTEALRGEGAHLITSSGRRFMLDEHPSAELAPRDVVARAIARRRREGDAVFLDATVLPPRRLERFRTVAALCAEHGLSLERDPLPVAPAAHYHMGGVVTDLDGRTSIDDLWACGETGFTGLHGANRLASNSLLEALVVGARCGEALSREPIPSIRPRLVPAPPGGPYRLGTDEAGRAVADRIRAVMDHSAGVERRQGDLRGARLEIGDLDRRWSKRRGETADMLLVSSLILNAAEARTESRGAHFRTDVPFTSPCWRQDLLFEGRRLLRPHSQPAAASL